jgi:TolB-like protein
MCKDSVLKIEQKKGFSMRNKKGTFLFMAFAALTEIGLLLAGCASNSNVAPDGKTLDEAIAEAAARIDERIEPGTKVALLNFASPSDDFSLYVLDELSANLLDSGMLTVVDRREVDLIRNEFEFQYSGEVGDDSMQELGRMLGAQSIVTGSLTEIAGEYRIVLRVLNVQSASVEVQYRSDIAADRRVMALLEGDSTGGGRFGSGSMLAGNRQSGTSSQTVTQQQVQQNILPFPRVGTWKVDYKDIARNAWMADLIITSVDGDRFEGYFDWWGTGGSAREYFTGRYDSQTRKLILQGTELENKRGNFGLDSYQGTLTRNGKDIESGTVSNKGSWTARFQE